MKYDKPEKVLGRRVKNLLVEYFIKFENKDENFNQWIPLNKLTNFLNEIATYENDLERIENIIFV